MRCPQCNEANKPMGSLATTNHYRCRACGWTYSQTRKPRKASASEQLAAGRRLLSAMAADHPHRAALERRVAQLAGA